MLRFAVTLTYTSVLAQDVIGNFEAVPLFEGSLPGEEAKRLSAHNALNLRKQGKCGSPTTIVGNIDTGYNLNQPETRHALWVNEGEIPGNGIDDDNNGFVDDVHGCQFQYDGSAQCTSSGSRWNFNSDHTYLTNSMLAANCKDNDGVCAPAGGCIGGSDGIRIMPLGSSANWNGTIQYQLDHGVRLIVASNFRGNDDNYQAIIHELEKKNAVMINGVYLLNNDLAYPGEKVKSDSFISVNAFTSYDGNISGIIRTGGSDGADFSVSSDFEGVIYNSNQRSTDVGYKYYSQPAGSYYPSTFTSLLALAWQGNLDASATDLIKCAKKTGVMHESVPQEFPSQITALKTYPHLNAKYNRISRFGILDVQATHDCLVAFKNDPTYLDTGVPSIELDPLFMKGLVISGRQVDPGPNTHHRNEVEWYIAPSTGATAPPAPKTSALTASPVYMMHSGLRSQMTSSQLVIRHLPLDQCYDMVFMDTTGYGFYDTNRINVSVADFYVASGADSRSPSINITRTILDADETNGPFAQFKITFCLGNAAGQAMETSPIQKGEVFTGRVSDLMPSVRPTVSPVIAKCPSCDHPGIMCPAFTIGDGYCDSSVLSEKFHNQMVIRGPCNMACYEKYDASLDEPCVLTTVDNMYTHADGGDCVATCDPPPVRRFVDKSMIGDGICDGMNFLRNVDLSCYSSRTHSPIFGAELVEGVPLDGGDCIPATNAFTSKRGGVSPMYAHDYVCQTSSSVGKSFGFTLDASIDAADCAFELANAALPPVQYNASDRTYKRGEIHNLYKTAQCCDDQNAATPHGQSCYELKRAYQQESCCASTDCTVDLTVYNRSESNRFTANPHGTRVGQSYGIRAFEYSRMRSGDINNAPVTLSFGAYKVTGVETMSYNKIKLTVAPTNASTQFIASSSTKSKSILLAPKELWPMVVRAMVVRSNQRFSTLLDLHASVSRSTMGSTVVHELTPGISTTSPYNFPIALVPSQAYKFTAGRTYMGIACFSYEEKTLSSWGMSSCTHPFEYTHKDAVPSTVTLPPVVDPVQLSVLDKAGFEHLLNQDHMILYKGDYYHFVPMFTKSLTEKTYKQAAEEYADWGVVQFTYANRNLLQDLCLLAATKYHPYWGSSTQYGSSTYRPKCSYSNYWSKIFYRTGTSDGTCGTDRFSDVCVFFKKNAYIVAPPPPPTQPMGALSNPYANQTYSNQFTAKSGELMYVYYVSDETRSYDEIAATLETLEGPGMGVVTPTATDPFLVARQCVCGWGTRSSADAYVFDSECVADRFTPHMTALYHACVAGEYGFNTQFSSDACDHLRNIPITSYSYGAVPVCHIQPVAGWGGGVAARIFSSYGDMYGQTDACGEGCVFFSTVPFVNDVIGDIGSGDAGSGSGEDVSTESTLTFNFTQWNFGTGRPVVSVNAVQLPDGTIAYIQPYAYPEQGPGYPEMTYKQVYQYYVGDFPGLANPDVAADLDMIIKAGKALSAGARHDVIYYTDAPPPASATGFHGRLMRSEYGTSAPNGAPPLSLVENYGNKVLINDVWATDTSTPKMCSSASQYTCLMVSRTPFTVAFPLPASPPSAPATGPSPPPMWSGTMPVIKTSGKGTDAECVQPSDKLVELCYTWGHLLGGNNDMTVAAGRTEWYPNGEPEGFTFSNAPYLEGGVEKSANFKITTNKWSSSDILYSSSYRPAGCYTYVSWGTRYVLYNNKPTSSSSCSTSRWCICYPKI